MQTVFHFSKTVESTLNSAPTSPHGFQRWVKFCLSYVEYIAPSEVSLETGRIVKLLSEYPLGLRRDEILEKFYANYPGASMNQQESLRVCLEKVIQRSRVIFRKYNLTITYCMQTKKYFLSPRS